MSKQKAPLATRPLQIILWLLALLSASAVAGAKPFTLVIDAGHGGKDYGAIGKNSREKDINLAVALQFGELVEKNMKGVRVVYTRSKDVYLTLQERADKANSCGGDLFVSIHTNSVANSNKNRTKIKGCATYTLGLHRTEENLEVAKRENSVIALESDYTTRYEGFDPNSSESYIMFELNQDRHLSQSVEFASLVQDEMVRTAGRANNGVRQAGFLVLARTTMPAVLVELDFICNPEQESFLNSKSGRQKLAKSLYDALDSYLKANKYSDGIPDGKATPDGKASAGDVTAPKPQADGGSGKPAAKAEGKTVYRVQFLTSETRLPETSKQFKGLSPVYCYKEKGLYKYTYGEAATLKEATAIQKEVRKKFKEAFVVTFKDGKRVK